MEGLCTQMKKSCKILHSEDLCDLFSAINIKSPQQEYIHLCSIVEELENGRPNFDLIKSTVLMYIKGIDFQISIRHANCDKARFKMLNIQKNLLILKDMFEKEKIGFDLYSLSYNTFKDILYIVTTDENKDTEDNFFVICKSA